MPLTDIKVRSAKPSQKPYKLADERGMYLLVNSTGGKLWRLDYRFSGKRKTLALGSYPDISLSLARDRRDEARKLVATGVDPSETRRAIKASRRLDATNSFEVIAREFISMQMADLSESHRDRVLRRFEIYLFPWIGSKPIAELTSPLVLECIQRVQLQNKLESAHRTLQAAGQVFRYAVQTGRATRDVTADLRGALPSPQVKHMAAFIKPDEVAELLRAIQGFKGSFTVQCALQLGPLVFVRPGELRTARWADIDLENAEWCFHVSKTKTEHIVPLSRQSIQIFRSIHPFSGHGVFVFPGGHDPKKPMSEAAINASLRRMGYDTKSEITGHGFRAMARTILHEELGFPAEVIEHQLAHKVPDALGAAYNRTRFLPQRKNMMQQWADYLDKLKVE